MAHRIIILIALTFSLSLSDEQNWLSAPNLNCKPINQLSLNKNSCGPASLLEAFQCGSEKWQFSIAQIKGETQKQRMMGIILAHGRKPSAQFPKQQRWQPRSGISGIDLSNMANEMRKKIWMGTVQQQLFFKDQQKSDLSHLRKTHQSLRHSLNKGLPPILTIRRMTHRTPHFSDQKTWLTEERHYLVLTGLPKKLPKNVRSFQISYRDPWGGHSYRGTIRTPIPAETSISTSILDLPNSKIGKELLKNGEVNALSLSSAIGVF